MANIFVAATATWNGKALKGARKDINTFEKQIQKLGRTIGVSLSAAALINYSKKAEPIVAHRSLLEDGLMSFV
jgi:hypothetical protein